MLHLEERKRHKNDNSCQIKYHQRLYTNFNTVTLLAQLCFGLFESKINRLKVMLL